MPLTHLQLLESARETPGPNRSGRAANPDPDTKLTLSLPQSVVRQLRLQTATDETTIRALILKALANNGYEVATAELVDRRRSRGKRQAIETVLTQ